MNKTCARCSKVVYPIEELKCLDKTWHKTCFKCHECGMTLNMKTYKGYSKFPYCEAHIPKAKATAIADTPELKRIAENTKIQSNVKYHADFEKQKGKFTQVADDPETLRIKQNTKIISNVAYHGDLEKKAAMERQRGAAEVSESRDNESEYFSETLAAEQLSQYQTQPQSVQQQATPSPVVAQTKQTAPIPNTMQQQQVNAQNNSQNYAIAAQQQSYSNQIHQHLPQQVQPPKQSQSKHSAQNYQQQQPMQQPQQQQLQQALHQQQQQQTLQQQQQQQTLQQQQQQQQHLVHQGSYGSQNYQQQQQGGNNYLHLRTSILQNSHHPSGGHHSQDVTKYYDQYENYARPSNVQSSQNVYNNNSGVSSQQSYSYQQPGMAPTQGYNPHYAQLSYANNSMGTNGGCNGSVLSGVGVMGSGIGKIADYDPLTDGPRNIPNNPRQSATLIYSSDRGSVHNSTYPKRVGSIADIDPANGVYGSLSDHNNVQNQYYNQQNQARQGHHHHPHPQPSQNQQQKPNMRVYRALYDYEAQDTDEVSFSEGDVIFEVESIDSGWMTGKVERTGKTGMLPANYIEPAVI